MASFDIVCEADVQKLDNTVNIVKKEVLNRYDFKGTETQIDLNKKDLIITLETENPMGIKAIEDLLITRGIKQGMDGRSFNFSQDEAQAGKKFRKTIKIRAGIDKEDAKKINKMIKDANLKVQSAIMDDMIRVTGKKIDDLQAVIAMLRKNDLGLPLKFINMK
ncbi:YajQ family cyclic di-GMP-binding protein [soil metagenome]